MESLFPSKNYVCTEYMYKYMLTDLLLVGAFDYKHIIYFFFFLFSKNKLMMVKYIHIYIRMLKLFT